MGTCIAGSCPSHCSGHGKCLENGVCECENGYTGIDCSTGMFSFCQLICFMLGKWCFRFLYLMLLENVAAVCDEQCSLHGGVCDNGVCEFRCSDYAGYTCQNSSTLLPSLSVCQDVLKKDAGGQHCAPSELSILQQLEEVVVMPNYHRLFPGGPRKFLNYFRGKDCDGAAKRLACWVSGKCVKTTLVMTLSVSFFLMFFVFGFKLHKYLKQISIQKCDKDGDNRLRVCHSACQSYNRACGASLDCSDQTLFSNEEEGEGLCTGWGELDSWF